jgi:hypothetical protein
MLHHHLQTTEFSFPNNSWRSKNLLMQRCEDCRSFHLEGCTANFFFFGRNCGHLVLWVLIALQASNSKSIGIEAALWERCKRLATRSFKQVNVVREGNRSISSNPPIQRHLSLRILKKQITAQEHVIICNQNQPNLQALTMQVK